MSNMPEFPELDPEQEHTAESLEKQLREYAQAVRSEFELASTRDKSAEDDAETFSVDFAKKNLGNNLAQLQWLAQNSTSDSVRANAAKYLVELARADARNDGDPIKKLLKELKGSALTPANTDDEGELELANAPYDPNEQDGD
jgi:beta-lactamase class A